MTTSNEDGMQHRDRDLDAFIKQPPQLRPPGQPRSAVAIEQDCKFAEKAKDIARLKEMRLASEKTAPVTEPKAPKKLLSKAKVNVD